MRGSSSCNVGMPAKEPLFEPHRILLYDPDHRYAQTKNQIHSLAYTYQFSPYGSAPVEVFSPGNNLKVTSEKMPEWMTVDPMKRDKVTFIEDTKVNKKQVKHNYPKSSYIQNDPQQYIIPIQQKQDTPKVWWLVIALLLIILAKKIKFLK